MALATGALTSRTGEAPGSPVFHVNVSFDGDDNYTTGGTLLFEQFVRDILTNKPNIEIIDIIPGDCGLFLPSYISATDALLVRNLTDGTQVSGATNLEATKFNVTIVAR